MPNLIAALSEAVTLLTRRTLGYRFQVDGRLPRLDAQTLCRSFACRWPAPVVARVHRLESGPTTWCPVNPGSV
jgi:hypothetical protein